MVAEIVHELFQSFLVKPRVLEVFQKAKQSLQRLGRDSADVSALGQEWVIG